MTQQESLFPSTGTGRGDLNSNASRIDMRTLGNGLFALGRKRAGEMNKTEKRYSQYLQARKVIGEISWFRFEPMTLKIANDCRYTPDFVVLLPDGRIQLHDIKGSKYVFTEDAKVKMKVVAQSFPFYEVFAVYPRPIKEGGGWSFEEFLPGEE